MSVRESVTEWFKRHLPIPEDGPGEIEKAERERQNVRDELDELERLREMEEQEARRYLERARDVLAGASEDEPLTLEDLNRLLTMRERDSRETGGDR